MKRLLALLLSLIMLVGCFAGCGEEKKPAENTDTPNTEEPSNERQFESPEIEALVVTAEAYLARKAYLQYDQARMIAGNVTPTTFRRDIFKNSPEDSTRQFNCYTTCSGFTADVYYQTFGFSYNADTTGALQNAVDMHVWSYYVTRVESEEEKETVKQEFLSNIKTGDILLCRHDASSGHAMFYAGDGKIIHSAAPDGGSFDFSGGKDKVEPKGSVALKDLDSLWNASDYYYFFDEYFWAIVRPLQKYQDVEITEQAKNRVANMQGIVAEKLSSHPVGFTVQPGEEITYTFSVKNTRDTAVTLEIVDTVPENTTYVKGAQTVEGNTLKWTAEIPASSTGTYEYTVKVNDDSSLIGKYVYSESTIGGVNVNCRKTLIGNNVGADAAEKILKAAEGLTKYTQTGLDLAKAIYADAGITIELDSATDIINGSFKPYEKSGTKYDSHFELDPDGKYFGMIVPTMYGGYYTAISPEYDKLRTRGMQALQLMAGDILIAARKDKVVTYMIVGNNKMLKLDAKATLLSLSETKDTLLSMMGQDKFVVIRPVMAK